tara:strand:+ start:22557 stop:22685 length:129 start_codon:yes stop_codon:yes gene_type:complete
MANALSVVSEIVVVVNTRARLRTYMELILMVEGARLMIRELR